MRHTVYILCLLARPAGADPCGGDLATNLRLSIADEVRRSLEVVDREALRLRLAYGPEHTRQGGAFIGGRAFGDRNLCVPDRDRVYELDRGVAGVEAHAETEAGIGLRVVYLEVFSSASSWGADEVQPEYRHTALGGFVRYADLLEVGALRFFQSHATVPGNAEGWVLSAGSWGVRSTVLLGDDAVQSATLGLAPIPWGPLALGGGFRHRPAEGVVTTYLELEDLVLYGNLGGGVFVDGDAEFELNTGRFRAATVTTRATWDSTPNLSALGSQGLDLVGVVRTTGTFRAFGSVFTGSRLDGTGASAVPGGGLAWEMGVYGRYAGFIVDASVWANDPVALEYSPDPTQTTRAQFMARLRFNQ